MLYHNSHDAFYRFPVEPAATGEKITLRFWCDEGIPTLRIWDGEEHLIPMRSLKDSRWESQITMPETAQLMWYSFIIKREFDIAQYGSACDQLGGVGQYYAADAPGYQLTVFDKDYQTPEYLHSAIAYQIFPDRYYHSEKQAPDVKAINAVHQEAYYHQNWDEPPLLDIDSSSNDNRALDFFGGNLLGITEKLPYLADLGITVLYLNPIFQARTNHRYDTGDYLKIDPILGCDSDFERLASEAEKYGIRIILDGVFSHTGSDSRYFNRFGHYDTVGAYQSEESQYAKWYRFSRFPDQYKSWWGFETLPELNKDNLDYRNFLLNRENGVLSHWLQKGAGGWRLDVADELPMNLIEKIRQCIRMQLSDAALLGEVWEDASNKVSYGELRSYCLGSTLDSVMNYPLRRVIIDFFTGAIPAGQVVKLILHQREVYPVPFLYSLMNLLGSHDRIRALNAFVGYDTTQYLQLQRSETGRITLSAEQLALAKRRYLLALQLLCALPGMPTVYYGDEIGMNGMGDPYNRAAMDWKNMDCDLANRVRSILQNRRKKRILQTGYLEIRSIDIDTIEIIRYAKNGRDVFGNPLNEENETVIIQRI